MKNKVMTLVVAGILTVGGISVAYAANNTDRTINDNYSSMMGAQASNAKSPYNNISPMMGTQNSGNQSNDGFENMVKVMEDNGLNDAATAMENRDLGEMNEFMTNINETDYKKMIEIMKNNGFEPMARMMQSEDKEDVTKIHQNMMER